MSVSLRMDERDVVGVICADNDGLCLGGEYRQRRCVFVETSSISIGTLSLSSVFFLSRYLCRWRILNFVR